MLFAVELYRGSYRGVGGGESLARFTNRKKTANHGSRLFKFHVQVCPTCKILQRNKSLSIA